MPGIISLANRYNYKPSEKYGYFFMLVSDFLNCLIFAFFSSPVFVPATNRFNQVFISLKAYKRIH